MDNKLTKKMNRPTIEQLKQLEAIVNHQDEDLIASLMLFTDESWRVEIHTGGRRPIVLNCFDSKFEIDHCEMEANATDWEVSHLEDLCESINKIWFSKSEMSDEMGDKQRLKQMELNFRWLLEKMDEAHRLLCPGLRRTWQERAEQVVNAARLSPAEKTREEEFEKLILEAIEHDEKFMREAIEHDGGTR